MRAINTTYLFSCVILTYILLKWVFKATGETERFLISVGAGLLLGIVWVWTTEVTYDVLILTYLASVGFYHTIVKRAMKYFDDNYNNGKGLV